MIAIINYYDTSHLKVHEPGSKQAASINGQDAYCQYYSHFFSFHASCIAKEMPEKEAEVAHYLIGRKTIA